MARRKRSYKVPPFRQLNPLYPNQQYGNQSASMFSGSAGFQPTIIRNETTMNAHNNHPDMVSMPTNPDGSAFNKQQAMITDRSQAPQPFVQPMSTMPSTESDTIDSSMEIATGQDMSKPIVDQNPQNKLEQLYKLS